MDTLRLGVDIGSTTAKLMIVDAAGAARFADYRRHNAAAQAALHAALCAARAALGDQPVSALVTGSAGMGLSERFSLPFIQEVVASAEVVRRRYPCARTLVDVGGEDAKLILFRPGGMPDIRMNGACAGGTGAFIDQMAQLLNVSPQDLDALAARHTTIHPIASRCGVFAKTDVQNLLSRDVGREDIAASIFHAVALQTLVTLARGATIAPQVLFCGGPLTFLPALRAAFARVLSLDPADLLAVERAELLPALGAALADGAERAEISLDGLITRLAPESDRRPTTDDPQMTDDRRPRRHTLQQPNPPKTIRRPPSIVRRLARTASSRSSSTTPPSTAGAASASAIRRPASSWPTWRASRPSSGSTPAPPPPSWS